MFTDINNINDYILKFELQRSEFLRDVLYPEIEFQLRDKGSNKDIIIYKINSPGIKEEITMDEFIYYVHYDVVECIQQPNREKQNTYAMRLFEGLFGSIQSIRNAVENMKILLTYEPSDEEEEES